MNKCPLCPKEYQSEKELQRHVKKIHGVELWELKVDSGKFI